MNIEYENTQQKSLTYFEIFSSLEKESKESIILKKLYVRICDDDLIAGLILSHIVFWFGNNPDGNPRAKHKHEGRTCIVRQRNDWWDECCISPKQYDRAINVLKERGFVDVEIHKSSFHKWETAHFIFINESKLMEAVDADLKRQQNIKSESEKEQSGNPELPKGEIQNSPKGKSYRNSPKGKSLYTENTTDITNNISPEPSAPSDLAVGLSSLLFEKRKEINPKVKKPNLNAWAKHIDEMIRLDGRLFEEIKQVIEYIPESESSPSKNGFSWGGVTRCAESLRKNFAELWQEMRKSKIPKEPKKLTPEEEYQKKEKHLEKMVNENKKFAQEVYAKVKSKLANPKLFEIGSTFVSLFSVTISYQDPFFKDRIVKDLKGGGFL
jgi:hypothetical protein